MNLFSKNKRFAALRRIGCMAARFNRTHGYAVPPMRCEIHHQNSGQHAGQKRLGDEYTVPLSEWSHRGICLPGMSVAEMAENYGPSLAHHSKRFREFYGSDESMLALANKLIENSTEFDYVD